MADQHLNFRVDEAMLGKLKLIAANQQVSVSSLARLYVHHGITSYATQHQQTQEKLDYLIQLLKSANQLSGASIAATVLLNSKGLTQRQGESPDQFQARYYADLKENVHTARKLGEQVQKSFSNAND